MPRDYTLGVYLAYIPEDGSGSDLLRLGRRVQDREADGATVPDPVAPVHRGADGEGEADEQQGAPLQATRAAREVVDGGPRPDEVHHHADLVDDRGEIDGDSPAAEREQRPAVL